MKARLLGGVCFHNYTVYIIVYIYITNIYIYTVCICNNYTVYIYICNYVYVCIFRGQSPKAQSLGVNEIGRQDWFSPGDRPSDPLRDIVPEASVPEVLFNVDGTITREVPLCSTWLFLHNLQNVATFAFSIVFLWCPAFSPCSMRWGVAK